MGMAGARLADGNATQYLGPFVGSDGIAAGRDIAATPIRTYFGPDRRVFRRTGRRSWATMKNRLSAHGRKGNTIVEFALVSVFLVPLMLGTVNVGLTLGRSIQVNQVCRDAGHMYVRQVDFTKPQNQNVIQRLADNLGFSVSSPSTSKGVIIFSKVLYMGAADCAGAGLAVANCPNYRSAVVMQRIVLGKSSLRASNFATPNPALIGSDGNIQPINYAQQSSCRTNGLSTLLTMADGDVAYVTETYFEAPEWKFPGSYELTGTYSRAIY